VLAFRLAPLDGEAMSELKRTPLYDVHRALGAKMVPFAGYEMPVQYPMGVLKEHLHARAACGLFDVSHMGQAVLRPGGSMEALLLGLERLMPVDALGLAEGRQRYGLLTNDTGGILDDLMFAQRGDHVLAVVNAARKDHDFAWLSAGLSGAASLEVQDRALIAVQGPAAEAVLDGIVPGAAAMRFMDAAVFGDLWISRSGYTGDDGFEVSVPAEKAATLWSLLAQHPDAAPIGLGARDSLRLEAGLCLYGHDIDETTSPVEAGLAWAIPRVRRAGGDRAGGFAGDDRILQELAEGPDRRRVGLRPDGRAPMREGTGLLAPDGTPLGEVTSGGYGPSVEAPIAMGYVAAAFAAPGTALEGEVRGKRLPVTVAPLPFRPATFKR
jgi:aminomethyltransferase